LNYPVLSLIFYEYDKKTISRNFCPAVELSEVEKEELLNKVIKYIQKEITKLKRLTCVPKREGN